MNINSSTKPLAALFVLATFAPALTAQPTYTNVQVPLSGTILVPRRVGSFADTVTLTGMVHVQTSYTAHQSPHQPHEPMQIYFSLDQVFGVGRITGQQYIAKGSKITTIPNLYGPVPMNVSFNLIVSAPSYSPTIIPPPNPLAPLDIAFLLTFNPDTGTLLNVMIESMSVSVP